MIAPDYASLLTSFTGADENPLSDGGNWLTLNTANGTLLRRLSNQVAANNTLTGEAYWTPASFQDFIMFWTITTLPGSGNSVRLYGRVTGEGGSNTWNGYGVRYQQAATSQLFLDKFTLSAQSTLASPNLTLSAGDKIGLACVGNMVQSWAFTGGAWSAQSTVFDTTYQGPGRIAIAVRATTGRADDLFFAPILNAQQAPLV